MTVDQDRPFRQAWIAANVPHQARLLVDDALWVDLVERGYPPGQVIWFYRLAGTAPAGRSQDKAARSLPDTLWAFLAEHGPGYDPGQAFRRPGADAIRWFGAPQWLAQCRGWLSSVNQSL
jgi:hypothetical protein